MSTLDVGNRLLIALVLKNDVMAFYGAKLQEKFFISDSEKKLYGFILSHLQSYSTLPNIITVEEKFGELATTHEPFEYYLNAVEERYALKHFHSALTEGAVLLKTKDIKSLVGSLDKSILDFRANENRQIVMDFGQDAHDLYKLIHAKNYSHDESLSIGWSLIDAQTHGMRGGDIFSFVGRPASGKAQPLDAKLLTLNGFISMGDAEVGMPLASIDGYPSTISGIYPQGIKQTYRVRLMDGRETECCAEHLWAVATPFGSTIRVLDTKFLLNSDNLSDYSIPIYRESTKLETIGIESITPSRQVECQCIRVSHPSKLYITDDYIVTHNTFLSLWVAYTVYMQAKKNVLFISMEMSRDILTYRMSAVLSKANMNEVLAGEVATAKLNDILSTLKGLQDLPQKLYFVDGGLKTTTDDVNALIQQYRPHLVVIDGAYLLQHPSDRINRYEKVAVNLERLKQLAEMYRIPMVLSYQFNRKAAEKKAKGESAGLEDIGYCLRGDQIISTTEGLIRIEDAYRLGTVTTFDGTETKESKVLKTGIKLECTVKFEDGTELICSPDHKVFISTKGSNYHWVRAEELLVGDTALTDISLNNYSSKDIEISPEMSEILGMVIGFCDCTAIAWIIPLSRDSDELITRVNSVLIRLYGYFGLIDCDSDYNYGSKSFIFDTPFIRTLLDLGVKQVSDSKKEVPNSVLSSSVESRGAFLRGVFETLGYFTPLGIALDTPSTKLSQDIHLLLKSLGIPSYISIVNGVNTVIVYKDYYRLFSRFVGFVSFRKTKLLNEVLCTSTEILEETPRLHTLKIVHVSISDVLTPMFDIAQEGGKHQFLASSILVHNSDVIPQISSVVLALKQPDSAETLKQRQLSVLKGRSGGEGTMVDIKWDFNKVDFSQIEVDDSEGDSNDDSHKYTNPTDSDDSEEAFSD